jgi:hypothetical protein
MSGCQFGADALPVREDGGEIVPNFRDRCVKTLQIRDHASILD